jgi:transcriptional regulator with XRE-family HTH domain
MSNDYKQERFLHSLAKRIVELRKTKNMTQERLASEADIDRVALANIETNKRRPTVTTIYKIAQALDISVEEIFKNLS